MTATPRPPPSRGQALAVVLLARLTAILPGHPDRMPTLLGEARVINDPRFDRSATLDRCQHQFAHLGQHRRPQNEASIEAFRRPARGAAKAAIGSTLLRSIGINSPRRQSRIGSCRSAWP